MSTLIIGKPGSGKSVCLIYLIIQKFCEKFITPHFKDHIDKKGLLETKQELRTNYSVKESVLLFSNVDGVTQQNRIHNFYDIERLEFTKFSFWDFFIRLRLFLSCPPDAFENLQCYTFRKDKENPNISTFLPKRIFNFKEKGNFYYSEKYDVFYYDAEKIVLFYDEAHNIEDSDEMRIYFSMHRHYAHDLYLATQNRMDLKKYVVTRCELEYKAKDASRSLTNKDAKIYHIYSPIYSSAYRSSDLFPTKLKISAQKAKEIYELYKSADSHIEKPFLFKGAIIALILLLALMIYSIHSIFTSGVTATPPAKPPAPKIDRSHLEQRQNPSPEQKKEEKKENKKTGLFSEFPETEEEEDGEWIALNSVCISKKCRLVYEGNMFTAVELSKLRKITCMKSQSINLRCFYWKEKKEGFLTKGSKKIF